MKLSESHEIKIKTGVEFDEIAWQLATKYFSNFSKTHTKVNISSQYDYYNMIFQGPKDDNIKKGIVFADGEPFGFYLGELDNLLDTFNLYALLVARGKYNYLTDYLLIQIFNLSPSKLINIGGSEDLGIHNFKLKYNPEKLLSMI